MKLNEIGAHSLGTIKSYLSPLSEQAQKTKEKISSFIRSPKAIISGRLVSVESDTNRDQRLSLEEHLDQTRKSFAGVEAFVPPEDLARTKDKNDQLVQELITNISLFITIQCMASYICGSSKGIHFSYQAIHKVKEENKTVWQAFLEVYGGDVNGPNQGITWFQWMLSGLFYLFLYKWIEIIPKTTDTYIKEFFSTTRSCFTSDNGAQNRLDMIRKVISSAKRVLSIHNLAFQDGQAPTEAELKGAVENLVKKDLKAKDLGEKKKRSQILSGEILSKISPRVPFHFFPSTLNYFIRLALSSFLSKAVSKTIEGGLNSVHSSNFSLALTKTIATQVEKLSEKFDQKSLSNAPPKPLPSFLNERDVNNLIETLLKSLNLRTLGKKDSDPLMDLLDQSGQEALRKETDQGIERGMLEVMKYSLQYLQDPQNTETLFLQLLNLINTIFANTNPPDNKQVLADLESAKKEIKDAGEKLIKKIVTEALRKELRGEDSEVISKRMDQGLFRARKEEITQELNRLQTAISQMPQEENAPAEQAKILETLKSIKKPFLFFEDLLRKNCNSESNEEQAVSRDLISRMNDPLQQILQENEELLKAVKRRESEIKILEKYEKIRSEIQSFKRYLENGATLFNNVKLQQNLQNFLEEIEQERKNTSNVADENDLIHNLKRIEQASGEVVLGDLIEAFQAKHNLIGSEQSEGLLDELATLNDKWFGVLYSGQIRALKEQMQVALLSLGIDPNSDIGKECLTVRSRTLPAVIHKLNPSIHTKQEALTAKKREFIANFTPDTILHDLDRVFNAHLTSEESLVTQIKARSAALLRKTNTAVEMIKNLEPAPVVKTSKRYAQLFFKALGIAVPLGMTSYQMYQLFSSSESRENLNFPYAAASVVFAGNMTSKTIELLSRNLIPLKFSSWKGRLSLLSKESVKNITKQALYSLPFGAVTWLSTQTAGIWGGAASTLYATYEAAEAGAKAKESFDLKNTERQAIDFAKRQIDPLFDSTCKLPDAPYLLTGMAELFLNELASSYHRH